MRWTDECSNAVGYKISERFRVLSFYNFFKQRYAARTDFTENYTKTEVGAGGELKVADKSWLFLRAFSGQQGYDTQLSGITRSNDASYSWKKVTTGLSWDSTAKFTGEVNIGYQWNSFDNSADINHLPYKDKSTWVAATVVQFRQSDARTFNLMFTRDMLQLGAGGSGYFTSTVLGLGLTQRIKQRLVLVVGGAYTKNNYSSDYAVYKHRHDSISQAQASLNYLLSDWLSVGIGYSRLKNSSTNVGNEYRVNQVGISLEMNPAFLGRRPREHLSAQE